MKKLSLFLLCALSFIKLSAQDFSIGDKIFIDVNEDYLFNSSDEGAIGVTINLWSVENGDLFEIIESTFTDNQGDYLFQGLAEGIYTVEISGANFEIGGSMEGFSSCAGWSNTDDGIDNDDNGHEGLFGSGSVWSDFIVVNDASVALDLEMTIDFCFSFSCQSYPMSSNCAEASELDPICSTQVFGNLCGSMNTAISTGNLPNPLCPSGGAPHNMSWFSFVAGSSNLIFELAPINCTDAGGFSGVQVGVYTDCSFQQSIFCNPNCQTAPSLIGSDINWILGDVYYVFLDGCAGSVCDFEVNLLEGEIGFDEEEIVAEVSCNSTVCGTYTTLQSITLSAENTINYLGTKWQIPEEAILLSPDSELNNIVSSIDESITIRMPVVGDYSVKLLSYASGCNVSNEAVEVDLLIVESVITVSCDNASLLDMVTPNDCLQPENIVSTLDSLGGEILSVDIPCFQTGAAINWYQLDVQQNSADYLMAHVQADGFTPVWTFFKGDDCENLSLVSAIDLSTNTVYDCSSSDGFFNNTHFIPFETGNTYWLAVSSTGDVIDPSFTLSYSRFLECIDCDDELVYDCEHSTWSTFVDGEEDSGPFVRGQIVTVCTEIDWNTAGSSNLWFHGIIPTFGSGWEMNSAGPSTQIPGNWEWIDAEGECATTVAGYDLPNMCTYTEDGLLKLCNKACNPGCPCDGPLLDNSPLPSGWFNSTSGGSGTCVSNSCIPADNYGVASGVMVAVDLCFDLMVKNEVGLDCSLNDDLQISLTLTSDAITGCWQDGMPCLNGSNLSSPEWKIDCDGISAPPLLSISVCADDLPFTYEGVTVDGNSISPIQVFDYVLPGTQSAAGGDSIVDIKISIIEFDVEIELIGCSEDGFELVIETSSNVSDPDATSYIWTNTSSGELLGEGTELLVSLDVTSVSVNAMIEEGNVNCSSNSTFELLFDSIEMPLEILGLDTLCTSNPIGIYTAITDSDNVVGYEWNVTEGQGIITELNEEGTIQVEWQSSEGTLCVRAVGECTMSDLLCFDVVMTNEFILSPPQEINGRDSLCSNVPTNVYTAVIPNDANVIDYQWEITSGEGSLTSLTLANQIFVNWTSSIGTICARTVGDCAISEQVCKDIVVIDAPVPNFSWTIVDADAQVVQFAYSGSQPIDSYFWDFGDGTTSNEVSPEHQFMGNEQFYLVSLTVVLGPCELTAIIDVDILLDNTKEIKEIESLIISPNPNNGLFYIDMQLSKPIDLKLEIMDIHGRVVQVQTMSNIGTDVSQYIDMSSEPSGTYLLRFIHGKQVRNAKVVLTK